MERCRVEWEGAVNSYVAQASRKSWLWLERGATSLLPSPRINST